MTRSKIESWVMHNIEHKEDLNSMHVEVEKEKKRNCLSS